MIAVEAVGALLIGAFLALSFLVVGSLYNWIIKIFSKGDH